MLRNLCILILMFYLFQDLDIFKNYPSYIDYKIEYIIIFFIILFYFIGNFDFYILQFYPKNKIIYFIIWGGYSLWREQIVMPIVSILLLFFIIYQYFTQYNNIDESNNNQHIQV